MAHWICKVCERENPCRLDMGESERDPERCVLCSLSVSRWERDECLTPEQEQTEPVTDCNQLPGWVEENAWVYISWDKEYDQITDVCKDHVRTDKNGWFGNIRITTGTIMQARLRPFNDDEMKALVGRVIEWDGDALLVTAFSKARHIVVFDYIHHSAEDLINGGYTIDGKPCGVLEHLENGEWVK